MSRSLDVTTRSAGFAASSEVSPGSGVAALPVVVEDGPSCRLAVPGLAEALALLYPLWVISAQYAGTGTLRQALHPHSGSRLPLLQHSQYRRHRALLDHEADTRRRMPPCSERHA